MPKFILFLLQSAVAGLAIAFLIVFFRPDLLENLLPATSGNGLAQPSSYADAVAAAAPAVVNINATRRLTHPQQRSAQSDNPLRRTPAQPMIQNSLGSGVIISEQGYVVTNNHLVFEALGIEVRLSDERVASARVLGTDPDTDLALLKIDLPDLKPITMGRSDNLRVGDIVLAIGNPFGIGQSVTQGIVSATGRSQLGVANFESFIQTDAAVNIGNSGGALVNARGELVGINTAILSSGNNAPNRSLGIGFAIPVNLARGVTTAIVEHGRVIRGWLGVSARDVLPSGIMIINVQADDPADLAGIHRGDIIVALDKKPVVDQLDMLNRIAMTPPGTEVRIAGFRSGQPFERIATVVERPPPQERL